MMSPAHTRCPQDQLHTATAINFVDKHPNFTSTHITVFKHMFSIVSLYRFLSVKVLEHSLKGLLKTLKTLHDSTQSYFEN